MALLSAASVIFSLRWKDYPLSLGIGAVIFMAVNAIWAVYPLYLNKGKRNPFNVYLGGMLLRLLLIGLSLILLLSFTKLSQAALLSLAFTAMIAFVAYLAVEIRHFIRNPSGLMTAGPAQ